jgi:hypothetical protein
VSGFEFKIPEWIGKLLSDRFLFAIWALIGVLLLWPPLTNRAGLSSFVAQHHDWLMLAFIGLSILLLTGAAVTVGKKIYHYTLNARAECRAKKHLRELPPDQKHILRMFAPSGNTHALHTTDGAVNVLVAYGIIYPAASLGTLQTGIACAVAPWALKYLRKHPRLLE